ncbi:hypothetical protein [Bacteroides clarus]|uniref:hypothetical protein n=1 Tax=Bacteroides clarus TaxID=626929 RepID=UPI0024B150F5|nr:hypothetical protein [Bacteroides clarus]
MRLTVFEKPDGVDSLPLEEFEVERIPLNGGRVERYGDFTDVFFYSTRTDPYMGIAPDFSKLKAYNRYMYALSLVPGRDL